MARFHLIQLSSVWENARESCALLDRILESEKPVSGSLVVLPELFDVGFTMNAARAAEHSDETRNHLRKIAARFGIHLIAGVARRCGNVVENQAVFIDPAGNEIGRFTKLHGFSLAGEDRAYRSGERVVVWDWNIGGQTLRIAPLICYDLRFPEVFRQGIDLGAQAFVVIANWPSTRSDHWNTLLRARAIENQALVVAVNRIGSDPNSSYTGESQVIDPWGEVKARAGAYETHLVHDFDWSAVALMREQYPFVRDRRKPPPGSEGLDKPPK